MSEAVIPLQLTVHIDRMSIRDLLKFADAGEDWQSVLHVLEKVVEVEDAPGAMSGGDEVSILDLPITQLRELVELVTTAVNEVANPGGD